MDAISGSENNAFVRAYGKPESTVSASKSTLPLDTAKVRLTDISDLSDRAASSTEDIRPDAVKRAQALLSDPNWPNDNDLEGLAEKLFSTEDFAG
jgi:hypothetical protein